MEPLYQELRVLAREGISVICDNGIQRTKRVHTLIFTGDIPAVAPLAGHDGHSCYRPCRICLVSYLRPNKNAGLPRRLPPCANEALRTKKKKLPQRRYTIATKVSYKLRFGSDLWHWNYHLQSMLDRKIIDHKFSTPNHHYMQHVTEAIRRLGHLAGYSTRCMERSIGAIKKIIKSNRD
ncbi:hypothetical protein BC941DRAFT_475014 [Chlamydoabsidia padenii]|nr:hypothetical protein BC941DRAFT_475014 [Chlamydoabsidia padenii]